MNEEVNGMTGCNPLHPLPTPTTVEPRHPGAPRHGAELEEGQKRKTVHMLLVPTFWKSEDQCWELQVQIKTEEQLGRPCWMRWGERLRQRIKEAAHVRRWVGEVGGAREVRGQI